MQLLGPDLSAHPVWNIRSKTPDQTNDGQSTVPWHQDNAYLGKECWQYLQLTAWIPLVDTNTENGCMQVCYPGSYTANLHHLCAQ